jgi:hypothetical protein
LKIVSADSQAFESVCEKKKVSVSSMNVFQRAARKVLGFEQTELQLREAIAARDDSLDLLQEDLSAALELAIEDEGWRKLNDEDGGALFSGAQRRRISQLARLMYLKNPVIKRAVDVQSHYVWGRGINVAATHPDVNQVIQDFIDDKDNQKEITSHGAQLQKEVELQTDGNIFFAFFIQLRTGRIKMRSFPHGEVTEIITDPEDRKTPRFYKREWTAKTVEMATGRTLTTRHTAYYPDWEYSPATRPARIGEHKIEWSSPIFHIKSGSFSDQDFGLSEVFSAISWAKAYKEFLEDRASVARALSVFAWKATGENGAKGLQKLKKKLGAIGAATADATGTRFNGSDNVSGVRVASTIATTKGNDIDPIKTSGATINPEEGRRFLLMVAAAFGIPETFFGDVSVGTLATAKSLNRPTEMMMVNRQLFWMAILTRIFQFVIDWAIRANAGALPGRVIIDNQTGERIIQIGNDTKTNKPMDRHIEITFPTVVEPDVGAEVTSIVSAATFLPDAKLVARLLLDALGVDDVDKVLEHCFDEEGNLKHPPQVSGNGFNTGDQGSDDVNDAKDKKKATAAKETQKKGCSCGQCASVVSENKKSAPKIHVEPGAIEPMSEADLSAALTFTAEDVAAAIELAGGKMKEMLTARPAVEPTES